MQHSGLKEKQQTSEEEEDEEQSRPLLLKSSESLRSYTEILEIPPQSYKQENNGHSHSDHKESKKKEKRRKRVLRIVIYVVVGILVTVAIGLLYYYYLKDVLMVFLQWVAGLGPWAYLIMLTIVTLTVRYVTFIQNFLHIISHTSSKANSLASLSLFLFLSLSLSEPMAHLRQGHESLCTILSFFLSLFLITFIFCFSSALADVDIYICSLDYRAYHLYQHTHCFACSVDSCLAFLKDLEPACWAPYWAIAWATMSPRLLSAHV